MMTINIEFNRAFNGVIYSKVNAKEQNLLQHKLPTIIYRPCPISGILYKSGM